MDTGFSTIRSKLTGIMLLSALLAVWTPAPATPLYRVDFALESLTLAQLPSSNQSIPGTGTLQLTFDAEFREFSDGDIQTTFFNAQNSFVSSVTGFVPRAPNYPNDNQDPRNLAVFNNVTPAAFSPPFSFLFWDDQHRNFDGRRDFLYRISLDTNSPGNDNPFVTDAANFRTNDLIGYLLRMQQNGEPLEFDEFGSEFDTDSGEFVRHDSISGLARIVAITAVPEPGSSLLLMAAFVGLAGLRAHQSRA